jgi:protocatechuate 3,4-dioxygenase beta subunit
MTMASDRIYNPLPEGSQPKYKTAGYRRTDTLAPGAQMPPLRTLTEHTGPAFQAPPPVEQNLVAGTEGLAIGQLMRLVIRVVDEDDRPQPGALIELWQANASGKYQHPVDQRVAPIDGNFRSWGRGLADENGEVVFLTIRPPMATASFPAS